MRHSLCIYGNVPNGLNQYHLGPVEVGGQGGYLPGRAAGRSENPGGTRIRVN